MSAEIRTFTREHIRNLIRELTLCEFKLRDQSTFFGFLWTLLNPALMFIVLYALFVKWMGNHVPSFPLYLLVGVVQWNYFVKGTTGGMMCVVQKATLINNFIFPKEVLVFSSVFTNLLIHLLEVAVMLIFLLALKAPLNMGWILLPFMVVLETLLILGVSFFLARLAVEYRDVSRIWEIVTMTGFFVTPIFFPIEIMSPSRQYVIMLSPMARLIKETRSFIVYGQWPDWHNIFLLLLVSAALLFWGYKYFKKGEPHFAEKFP